MLSSCTFSDGKCLLIWSWERWWPWDCTPSLVSRDDNCTSTFSLILSSLHRPFHFWALHVREGLRNVLVLRSAEQDHVERRLPQWASRFSFDSWLTIATREENRSRVLRRFASAQQLGPSSLRLHHGPGRWPICTHQAQGSWSCLIDSTSLFTINHWLDSLNIFPSAVVIISQQRKKSILSIVWIVLSVWASFAFLIKSDWWIVT